MKPEFPEGVTAFQLSADIDPANFGGGLCVAGDIEYNLGELLDAGDGYIATGRPALIQLLDDLEAFAPADLADVPPHALVEGWEVEDDPSALANPGGYTVPEVLEALRNADAEQAANTLRLEAAGRGRQGILSYEPPAPEVPADGEGDDQGEPTGDAETTGDADSAAE